MTLRELINSVDSELYSDRSATKGDAGLSKNALYQMLRETKPSTTTTGDITTERNQITTSVGEKISNTIFKQLLLQVRAHVGGVDSYHQSNSSL